MSDHHSSLERKGQTAIEYMLLLMAVVIVVIIGIQTYFPYVEEASNTYYNRVVPGILGMAPRCGDGVCAPMPVESCCKCPTDCGSCGGSPPPGC